MTEIVESEIANLRSAEQIIEAPLHSLPAASCAWLGGQNTILADDGRVSPYLYGQLLSHRHVSHLPALQLGPNCNQPFAVHDVRPSQAEDLRRAHPCRDGDEHEQSKTKVRSIEVLRSSPVQPFV